MEIREEFSDEGMEKAIDIIFDAITKLGDIDDERDPRKKAQTDKKMELKRENIKLERKLSSVTNNSYVEIGEIMNEYYERENQLLQEIYDKCKNWLDENNKPYEEKLDV